MSLLFISIYDLFSDIANSADFMENNSTMISE
jgi:hypothetical protein